MESKDLIKEVKTVKIYRECECGGILNKSKAYYGDVEESIGSYIHICDKCNKSQSFDKIYPYIKHVVDED